MHYGGEEMFFVLVGTPTLRTAVVAYPEQGIAWVATRVPELPAPEDDPGIIARFDLPDPQK